jgi:predicted small secreted protein
VLISLLKETVMKKVMAVLLLAIYAVLMGCNTMEGLGRDLSRGGDKLQDEAREHKR